MMTRIIKYTAAIVAGALATDAFTVSSMPKTSITSLRMSDDDTTRNEPAPVSRTVERGVSLDQDGKSNVWAIEPKMEVDSKSSEEQASSALFAVGGFAAFAAVAAGILTNLPDPDQF